VFDRPYPYHLLYTQRGCLNSRLCSRMITCGWGAIMESGTLFGVRSRDWSLRERESCGEKWLLNMWCDRGRRCAAIWVFPQSHITVMLILPCKTQVSWNCMLYSQRYHFCLSVFDICFWPKVNYGLLLSSSNSHVCVNFILPHWKHSYVYRIMKGVKSVPWFLSYQTSVFSTGILDIELCRYEFVELHHKVCCTDCNLSLMGMWTKY
jgi:hypothetical protein